MAGCPSGCDLVFCPQGQECVEDEDGAALCVDIPTDCPEMRPETGDACNWGVGETCYWGTESCCGETFDSYGCQCFDDGTAGCFATDRCLLASVRCPSCDDLSCEAGEICVEDEDGVGSCIPSIADQCETGGCSGQLLSGILSFFLFKVSIDFLHVKIRFYTVVVDLVHQVQYQPVISDVSMVV